jgi:antitoxin CptB
MTDLETRRRKLKFRAQRRGFKEMDLIFGAFAERHLAGLDEAGLDRVEALLDVPDWQLYGWIVGHEPVPNAYDDNLFARLRAYRDTP